ncbi:hypothetical protein [Aureimonas sp. AU12]|uniref:hypothetical protein n=1 Tax=Aureimonas sp. AU12 TaxID=1638161 RepID=UPI00078258FB|nr:hypothetical protein [Aureimonas sp. AU12]
MPVRIVLLASASLAFALAAHAETPVAAPDFGAAGWGAPQAAAPGAPAPSIAVPLALQPAASAPVTFAPAPVAAPVAAAPTAAGVNPFAVMVPPPAAKPAAPVNPFVTAEPAPAAAAPSAPAAAFSIEPAKPDAQAAAAAAPQGADDGALRYYASQRDMVRVGAEIRRLKSLYPDWQPPADLFGAVVKVNEQPVWDRYALKDFTGAREVIETLRTQNPGWEPSGDLTEKLADAEIRTAVDAAYARQDWQGVLDTAQSRPTLLTCANVDMLWKVGEGFARASNLARSYDLYSYILAHCDNPGERLATVQKASAVLPPQGVDALLGFGRPTAAGQREFDGLRFDTLRGQMGKVAAREAGLPIDAAQLSSFATYVGATRSANDAALFGWYYYGLEQWSDAANWFKAAGQLDPDPKNLEGYILALRNGGDLKTAEALAYDNRARTPEIAKIYVEIVSDQLTGDDPVALDDAALRRIAAVVETSKSPLGAQSIGWNLVAAGKVDEAKGWFTKSVDWEPTREGVVGLAVVAARLKDTAGLRDLRTRYTESFPELASFKESAPPTSLRTTSPAPRQTAARSGNNTRTAARSNGSNAGGGGGGNAVLREAQKAFDSGDYKGALATLDEHERRFGQNRGASLLRGWTNFKMRRFSEAREIFKAEDKRQSTKDTRFGIGATFNSQSNAWR